MRFSGYYNVLSTLYYTTYLHLCGSGMNFERVSTRIDERLTTVTREASVPDLQVIAHYPGRIRRFHTYITVVVGVYCV